MHTIIHTIQSVNRQAHFICLQDRGLLMDSLSRIEAVFIAGGIANERIGAFAEKPGETAAFSEGRGAEFN